MLHQMLFSSSLSVNAKTVCVLCPLLITPDVCSVSKGCPSFVKRLIRFPMLLIVFRFLSYLQRAFFLCQTSVLPQRVLTVCENFRSIFEGNLSVRILCQMSNWCSHGVLVMSYVCPVHDRMFSQKNQSSRSFQLTARCFQTAPVVSPMSARFCGRLGINCKESVSFFFFSFFLFKEGLTF